MLSVPGHPRESSRKSEHSQLKVLKELVEHFKVTTAWENHDFNSQCFAIFHRFFCFAKYVGFWEFPFYPSHCAKHVGLLLLEPSIFLIIYDKTTERQFRPPPPPAENL